VHRYSVGKFTKCFAAITLSQYL